MKAFILHFLSRQARWFRRRAGGILICLVFFGVVCFTLALYFYMDIGFRQEPDAKVSQALQMAESCRDLAEKRQAIRALDELRAQSMMSATRARLLLALGDLHRGCFELDPGLTAAVDHLDYAARFYREAHLLHGGVETALATRAAMAHVEFLRGNWQMARSSLEHLLRGDLDPAQRAAFELLTCRSLVEMGEIDQAYAILEENLGRYTAGPVHDQAKILAAELLVGECRRRQGAVTVSPTVEGEPQNPPPGRLATFEHDTLVAMAREMLTTMLDRLPGNDLRRMQVLNDLLELCLLTGDVDTAYLHVRELEKLAGHRDQQIRSFDLLATLEQSQGNLADAENALRFCIKQFPEHEMSHRMRFRLYHMLREQERTEEALGIFASLVRYAHSRAWGEWLTEEMLPENPQAIYHGLPDAAEKAEALAAMRRQVRALAANAQPRWLLVRERLLYLEPALAELANDGGGIENGVAAYLVEAPFGNYMGEILRMDALCAETMSRSPAVRATRAHRYLARFPEGRYGEDMLGILLRAYYEMGLYRENLLVAEAAFIHAMVRNVEDSDQAQRLPVLQTMRWIAQCNSRLGRSEVAAALFNRCAQRFDLLLPDGEFFRDWAGAALAAGQQREAIRRLEVGMQRLPAGPDRERLADQMLEARYRIQGALAVPAIEQRIGQLRQAGQPLAESQFAAFHELIFDHVMNHEIERMPKLVSAVRTELPEALWPSLWAMRYLQRRLQEGAGDSGRPYLEDVRTMGGGKPGTANGAGHIATCLHYLDTLVELEKRMGELHERGL